MENSSEFAGDITKEDLFKILLPYHFGAYHHNIVRFWQAAFDNSGFACEHVESDGETYRLVLQVGSRNSGCRNPDHYHTVEYSVSLDPKVTGRDSDFVLVRSPEQSPDVKEGMSDKPVFVSGFGLDHWVAAEIDYERIVGGSGHRFLVRTDFTPKEDVEAILSAVSKIRCTDNDVTLIFFSAFDADPDLVTLVNKSRQDFGADKHVLYYTGIRDLKAEKALFSQVDTLISLQGDNNADCDVARAFAIGLASVTGSVGPHTRFANKENAWLCQTDFGVENSSISAFPSRPISHFCKEHLQELLEKAYEASVQSRSAMVAEIRQNVLDTCKWEKVVGHVLRLQTNDWANRTTQVAWLSTWNTKCGIAIHAANRTSKFPQENLTILAPVESEFTQIDGPNVYRVWKQSKDLNYFDNIFPVLLDRNIDAVMIEFHYSFFNHQQLSHFIYRCVSMGVNVYVTLHSTTDPYGDTENFRLADMSDAFTMCRGVYVHSHRDMIKLTEVTGCKNGYILPLGIEIYKPAFDGPKKSKKKTTDTEQVLTIATFGFCLPNKGLIELVEAVNKVNSNGMPVKLLMLNAEHPAPESGKLVKEILRKIKQNSEGNNIEFVHQFLPQDELFERLTNFDILINPYQMTAESASSSVRVAASCGIPVAVTPLPIFDDLGDMVVRFPGTSVEDLATGLSELFELKNKKPREFKNLVKCSQQLAKLFDYAKQAEALGRIFHEDCISTLLKHENTNQITLSDRFLKRRGLFINTAPANCSIYESGLMVFNNIRHSWQVDWTYLTISDFSLGELENSKKLVGNGIDTNLEDYDFLVINWHPFTMEGQLSLDTISSFETKKFCIVLELDPSDTLAAIPKDIFDGYIALDPTLSNQDRIHAFPRPLVGKLHTFKGGNLENPTIGSFGFGTPGKGFPLVVQAVNKEFDKATVRINIPLGDYANFDHLHNQSYCEYIKELCEKIAKPGIKVNVTFDFMTQAQMIDWCRGNDLNFFFYTRDQTGLAATTDQCILAGRPLLTSSNATFRHISQRIEPYPTNLLRDAMTSTSEEVRSLQKIWSKGAFLNCFHAMLADNGILQSSLKNHVESDDSKSPASVVMITDENVLENEIFYYSSRLKNALEREQKYSVDLVHLSKISKLRDRNDLDTVIFCIRGTKFADKQKSELSRFADWLITIGCTCLVLETSLPMFEKEVIDNLVMLKDNPIVPYYTVNEPQKVATKHIAVLGSDLAGEASRKSIAKLLSQFEEVVVSIFTRNTAKGIPADVGRLFKDRQNCELISMPKSGESFIREIAQYHLILLLDHCDKTNDQIDDIISLSMSTERAIAVDFEKQNPWEEVLPKITADSDLNQIISDGVANHIEATLEFGEWTMLANFKKAIHSR